MLVFVGAEPLLVDVYRIPVGVSPDVLALVLATAVAASLLHPKTIATHDRVTHDPLAKRPPDPVLAPIDAERADE